jgi:hypothetical protein
MTHTPRVLVVAHRTAATPALLEAVRERAARDRAAFTLLVPKPVHGLDRLADPEDVSDQEAQTTLDLALPLLEEAAGGPVEGVIGVSDPLAAVEDAVNTDRYDEVIISTLSRRVSRWLHLDLPRKVGGLGLPVHTVTAKDRAPINV